MSDFLPFVKAQLDELLNEQENCKPFVEAVKQATNVWQIPELLEKYFSLNLPTMPRGCLPKFTDIRGRLFVGEETKIESFCLFEGQVYIGNNCAIEAGCKFKGPVYVGDNSRIGPNAYLRQGVIIGENCHVGHCSEIKNSVILSHSNAPHRNYVGDSVIGEHCNLGDKTTLANLRLDEKPVIAKLPDGNKYDSGRKKLGAVLENYCKTGCNVVLNPGSYLKEKTVVVIKKGTFE
ncbi:MAG: hypothetical protein HY363_06055 [Candidatus Aenigmarchaeota archaeon]|nr:hypothetical protein [Candidatus Aenigmarchaeota archaeon]